MPLKDREKSKAYGRIWVAAKRAKNPEPHREANRKYRAAHPDRESKRARRAITVVLDLMHPIRAGRRLESARRDAGVDEAIGANNEHGRQIAARHRAVKSSTAELFRTTHYHPITSSAAVIKV
jgi:hypothetical protein